MTHIAYFDLEATKHKRLYRTLRIATLSLLAAATALAAIAATFSEYGRILNVVIVAVTAAAGVLTSIEGMRRPAELWGLERRTYHALRGLKEELDFQSAEGNRSTDLDDYFTRMRGIINEHQQKWQPGQGKPPEKQEP
jgi:hypothetical protein